MKKFFSRILFSTLTLLFLLTPFLLQAVVININTASLSELDKIPEVGPVTAGLIIKYREDNGLFKTIDDIKNVKGIGDITFSKMKDSITVGNVNDSVAENTSNGVVENTNNSNNESLSDGGGESSHTSQADLSDYKESMPSVGSGRKRLATVRTPINFSAYQANKKVGGNNTFTWSFGDGTSATGEKVSHSYQFAGQYNVVLNAYYSDGQESVSRTSVLVAEPKLSLVSFNKTLGYLEINNASNKEQNLNDWLIVIGSSTMRLPLDTIISGGSSLKITLRFNNLDLSKANNIILAYPDGGEFARLGGGLDKEKITALRQQLVKIKQEMKSKEFAVNSPEFNSPVSGFKQKTENKSKNVIVLKKEEGILSKIKNAIF